MGGARARSSVECPLGGVSSGSKAAPKPCPSPTTHALLLPVFPQTLAMRDLVPGSALRATVSGQFHLWQRQWLNVAVRWPLPDPLQEKLSLQGDKGMHPGSQRL